MSFNDIFKSSFLENFTAVSFTDIAISLALAFLVGLFIFFVYKKTYSGVMFSMSFGGSLIAMTMVTTMVVLAVTSNVVLSLGMVGALSIVRFRAAVKEPMDIAFLFWAVAAGIVLAAGMIPLAAIGSLIIGIIMLIFCNRKSSRRPYIAVITCADTAAAQKAEACLRAHVSGMTLKSKTARDGNVELSYEVTLRDDNTDFVSDFTGKDGIFTAVLVSYNGDYMG